MAYVEITKLDKRIKDNVVLNDINLKLEKGNIYGFLGRNGSGKSMLFRAICGLIKPTNGQVKINNKLLGKDIGFPQSCGVIIESCGFWNEYTGYENLKKLASIKNIIKDEEIIETLISLGLDPADKRPFKKYSLGMKQKLALAQALMEKPDLIILDEPTNALDEESVEVFRNIILEEKKRGALILIASHNREDINLLADFKFRMDKGKIKPII